MRFGSALAAGASLVGPAMAFLVVPEMMPPVREPVKAQPAIEAPTAFDLKCQGCVFTDGENVIRKAQTVHVEFAVQGRQLLVNDAPVLSAEVLNGQAVPDISVYSVYEDGERSAKSPVNFGLSIPETVLILENNPIGAEDEAVTVVFTIVGMDGHRVNAQAVEIGLIISEKEYTISSIDALPFEAKKGRGPRPDMCENARHKKLCMLRSALMMRIEEMFGHGKGMEGGMKTHGGPGNRSGPCPGRFHKDHKHQDHEDHQDHKDHKGHRHPHEGKGDHDHHHPHHEHHEHHEYHKHHKAMRIMHTVVKVVVRLAWGVLCFCAGMAIGRFINFFWCTVVRGGRRGNASHARVVGVTVEEHEKASLMAGSDEEQLPAYRDEEAAIVEEKQETKA